MKIKQILSSLLAATMIFGSVTANAVTVESKDVPERSGAAVETVQSGEGAAASDISNGTILHAWCWSCATIKANMADIAAAGYSAVQTSPMNTCYKYSENPSMKLMGSDYKGGMDDAWWWHYQPVDFKLGNYQFFTNPDNELECIQEYSSMCQEAEKYGIKIITDIVTNHTAKDYTQVSNNLLSAVGIDARPTRVSDSAWLKLYHADWNTLRVPDPEGFVLSDNEKRRRETFWNLEGTTEEYGLRDINTENKGYQAYVIDYLNTLVEAGCDGFRFDAVKHIATSTDNTSGDFWNILGTDGVTVNNKNHKLDNPGLFIYGESLGGPYAKYTPYMGLAADGYGHKIRNSIYKEKTFNSANNSVLSTTLNFGDNLRVSDIDKGIVTWVESHDTYCNDHDSAKLTDTQIRLGWVAIAARSVGTPLFYSRPDGSDGPNGNYLGNNVIGAKGNDEFKAPEVVAANKFRNAMVGNTESVSTLNSGKILMIQRYPNSNKTNENCGVCFVNLGGDYTLSDVSTNLAEGTYTDAVSGSTFTVSNTGLLSGEIGSNSAAVVYKQSEMILSASSESTSFTDTLDVQMTLKNAKQNTTGSYTVEADNRVIQSDTFDDGDTVTIGDNVTVANRNAKQIVLTISAVDSNGITVSQKYKYTKTNTQGITVYFDNTDYTGWGQYNAYIYAGEDENAAWPGVAMSLDSSTGYYKVDVPANLKYGKITFVDKNNTSNRFPAKGQEGLQLSGKTQLFSDGALTDYDDNPDNNSSITKDNYIYFLNTIAPANSCSATLLDSTGSTDVSMSYSEDMHCYYLKYDSTNGYTKVQFTDNVNVQTGFVDLQPGMVFVTTSYNNGEWISPIDLEEHTIYFENNSNTSWSNVYAYMWNGTESRLATWPGIQMTKMEDVGGFDSDIYSLTYYYPKVSNGNSDYTFVIFNGGSSSAGQTADLKIPVSSDNKTYVYKPTDTLDSDNHRICTRSEMKDSVSVSAGKNIAVTFKYYDERIAPRSSGETHYENVYQVTVNQNNFKDQNNNVIDIKGVIANAKTDFNEKNLYDTYYVETSQLDYVTSIAARTNSSRISGGLNYGSKINPKFFAHQTGALSSIYSSSLGNLQTAQSNEKWITYKNGNDTVEYKDIKPDFSNVTGIEIWAFSMPREYSFNLHYPKVEATYSPICGKNLYLAEKDENHTGDDIYYVKHLKANYNELDSTATNIASDMYIPDGYVFDGWYKLEHTEDNALASNTTGYIKVSSDKDYRYRLNSVNLDLYALFRPNGSAEAGCAALSGDVDQFTNSGVPTYRFNTYLNTYNVSSRSKITDVAVLYVNMNSGISTSDLQNYLNSTDDTTLRKAVGDSIASSNSSGEFSFGKISGSYLSKEYVTQYAQGRTQTVTLTNKNRLQYVLTLTNEQLTNSYHDTLAFTAYKIGENWTVSSNCVYYKNGVPTDITIGQIQE